MRRDKHLGLTIDAELHGKLRFISSYEGRSMSGEIMFLIRTAVREFEKVHGVISEEDLQ